MFQFGGALRFVQGALSAKAPPWRREWCSVLYLRLLSA